MKPNKKRIFILITFLLLIATVIFLFFYHAETFSRYEKYSKYGTVSENKESKEIIIRAFLKFIEEEDNKYCLQFISMTEKLEEFSICTNKEILKWKNPYEDYSKLIPVNIVLNFDKAIFNMSLLKEISIVPLEDDEFMDFLHEMNEERIKDFQVRIKSNEEVVSKGYYYQEVEGEDFIAVTIIDSFVKNIDFKNDKLEVTFNSIIQGTEVLAKILVEEVLFSSYDDNEEIVTISINKDNIDLLSFKNSVIITLKVKKGIDVDTYMVENFVDQSKSVPINLESISIFQGISYES
jgi:hypothetical protein